jgi:hypothetical protein
MTRDEKLADIYRSGNVQTLGEHELLGYPLADAE